jgi:hypothetical protein
MKNMSIKSLNRKSGEFIDTDLPSSARIALHYLFSDLYNKNYLVGENEFLIELFRTGRITTDKLPDNESTFMQKVSHCLNKLDWLHVYVFCGRVYEKLLRGIGNYFDELYVDVDSVRIYYTNEINRILDEENLGYQFVDGEFRRRGKFQTQRTLDHTGMVLADPALERILKYYNKARRFFEKLETPDYENCVKDAMCSIEACIEVLTGKDASTNFDKVVKQLEGNGQRQIPVPIAQSLVKLHSYRGSAQGVGHAAITGNRVNAADAELVLSLTAAHITYLTMIFPIEDEIPF